MEQQIKRGVLYGNKTRNRASDRGVLAYYLMDANRIIGMCCNPFYRSDINNRPIEGKIMEETFGNIPMIIGAAFAIILIGGIAYSLWKMFT